MCVLALAWKDHPRWRVVIAGNRDEFHTRPTLPLSRWLAPYNILAGRDLQSGGTWLGVSESGVCGVITNFRGHGLTGRPSRGILLRDIVSGTGDYSRPSDTDLASFNPLNLIIFERENASFITNRPVPRRNVLAPGTYALSNGTLDEPWLKTLKLKRVLVTWMEDGAKSPELLLNALGDHAELKPGDEFPPSLAVPANDPRSPIFIRDTVYGTRCSTVVAIDDSGQGTIIERRFDPQGAPTGETTMTFSWPKREHGFGS
jgi:uncharacterized protein with NRDE domain